MDRGPAMRWRATVRTVIRLVPVTMDLIDAGITGDDALALALGHDVTRGWLTFREALPVTRNALAASPPGSPWGARLFVSGEPPELIGWGGFKGGPEGGAVEIGYEIAESRRGRGLATAAARAMVAEAFADPQVMRVIAHAARTQCLQPHPREGRRQLRRRKPRGQRTCLALRTQPPAGSEREVHGALNGPFRPTWRACGAV
jgi:ribosomal-protein-alanine N-acetyltransferase